MTNRWLRKRPIYFNPPAAWTQSCRTACGSFAPQTLLISMQKGLQLLIIHGRSIWVLPAHGWLMSLRSELPLANLTVSQLKWVILPAKYCLSNNRSKATELLKLQFPGWISSFIKFIVRMTFNEKLNVTSYDMLFKAYSWLVKWNLYLLSDLCDVKTVKCLNNEPICLLMYCLTRRKAVFAFAMAVSRKLELQLCLGTFL